VSARALVLVFAMMAGCTTEISSDPAPGLTTLPSTTTTTTTSTTTTTTTDFPTTTLPETTTTLASVPVARSFPLLIGGSAGGWLLLGSWEGDRWADDDPGIGEPGGPTIDAGAAFTAGNLQRRVTGAAGALTEACFDERVGPVLDLTVSDPEPPGYGYGAVAIPEPEWPTIPRPIATTRDAPAAYRTLAIGIFGGDPVDASRGTIEQLVITDLDGDGDDEALVVFEFVQPGAGPGMPGDLSAVVLVDAVTRNASTVRKAFVPTNLAPEEFPATERSRILDVADYNGDGVAEVAVHSWYFEGAAVTLYAYDGAELRPVLSAGCGG
jgi:hypothetical protein